MVVYLTNRANRIARAPPDYPLRDVGQLPVQGKLQAHHVEGEDEVQVYHREAVLHLYLEEVLVRGHINNTL